MIDIAIIGAGPAGLAAGLYAARGGFEAVIFEQAFVGGQSAYTYKIENYPGFADGVGGADLAQAIQNQAVHFGAKIQNAQVKALELGADSKKIHTSKDVFEARTVILCMGANARHLGLSNEASLLGAGVSYCAVCDGAFFKNKPVAVIGGGDTALHDAIYLAKFASKVYVVHRRDTLRASKSLQDTAMKNEHIIFIWDTQVEQIIGEGILTGLKLKNSKTAEVSGLEISGLFIAIGSRPNTKLVAGSVKLDDNGYIITDGNMATNIPGVFAAGDIRVKPLRQVVTAVADGALAATEAISLLNE